MTTKGTKATEVKSEEDGAVLGEYFADLFADNRPIIELKTCKALANEQTAQVLGYLCSSGQRHALLIHLVPQEFNSKKTVL